MIRIAFTLIGGRAWPGGYNYLLNLVRALAEHESSRVQPVMFFGENILADDLDPFAAIPGVEIVRDRAFDPEAQSTRFREAVAWGVDRKAAELFKAHRIDLAFENARFYGWRFPVRCLAWIPDFQHKRLRQLFGKSAYWKREIGFLAQIAFGRAVLLSSEDARRDCEEFYPRSRSRIQVVRFAVPQASPPNSADARAIADSYGLPETFFYLPNQFYRHKNHMCVVRALHALRERGAHAVVAASGKQEDYRDSEFFPRLRALIGSLGVADMFPLLGLIPHQHIPALMRASAAMINPSTFEGWSTTVEEAKATGTPMLLSNLRVHREQAEGTASFFDPERPEELADLLESFVPLAQEERQRRADRAVAVGAERMKVFAEEFARVCETVVDGKAAR